MRISSKNIYKDEIQAGNQPVHETLEGLAGILESEGHAQKLPEPERSYDGRLGYVLGPHRDLVIPLAQV